MNPALPLNVGSLPAAMKSLTVYRHGQTLKLNMGFLHTAYRLQTDYASN